MHLNKLIPARSSDASKLVFIILFTTGLIACTNNRFKYRVIALNGLTVKGKMTKDTLFDGEIRYYRDTTLIGVRNFNQGKEEGQFVNYYRNNKVEQTGYVKNGLTEGMVSIFDEQGQLIRQENYYKGRLMGPQIRYDSNKLKSYSFLNFENDVLCTLSYYDDYTTLDEGNPVYNVFSELTVNDSNEIKIFCYVFNPPKFRCKYVLGKILGDRGETFTEIQKINTNDLFFEKSFPVLQDSTFHYCVKADIFDSTSKHSRVYYGVY